MSLYFRCATPLLGRGIGPVAALMMAATILLFCDSGLAADTNAPAALPRWLVQPMSLEEAIRIALLQNSAILKGKSDVEAAYGLVIQTRAIALPKVRGTSSYDHNEAVERFTFGARVGINPPKDEWVGNLRIVQTVYEGGRIRSALRTATSA